jgi:hypothetical protein
LSSWDRSSFHRRSQNINKLMTYGLIAKVRAYCNLTKYTTISQSLTSTTSQWQWSRRNQTSAIMSYLWPVAKNRQSLSMSWCFQFCPFYLTPERVAFTIIEWRRPWSALSHNWIHPLHYIAFLVYVCCLKSAINQFHFWIKWHTNLIFNQIE